MHVHYDTPPVVPTSVLPANGATVAGNVTLSGIYNDPDSGDGGKVYWIIKNAAGTVVRTVTGSHVGCDTTPSTCAPHASTGTPSPPLPAGNYTLQAKSNDGLIRWDGTPEESGLSPQTAFTVANTAPALPTITAPTDGDGLGRTISLRASYSDLNGDPGIVQFELVNANDDSVVATSSATIAPVVSGGSVTSTLTAPADDAYMVAARAFDGSTWSAWTDPENIIFAADNSWDATDGNLSVTPSIDSSVQDTNAVNPTLDATVKTNSLDRVAHAEFSLYARQPDGSNGVLVYTGIGDETVSGDISSIAVPTGVLSAGAAYNVHAALVQDDGVTVGGVDLSIVAGSTVVPEALDDSDGVYPTDRSWPDAYGGSHGSAGAWHRPVQPVRHRSEHGYREREEGRPVAHVQREPQWGGRDRLVAGRAPDAT
jgi:hypothetical protein